MSTVNSPAAHSHEPAGGFSETVLHPKKSYRRKYRKMMIEYEEKMGDNEDLFYEEQRLLAISRRLAEDNDQLQETLLEMNSQPHIPSDHRYDLTNPYSKYPEETHEDRRRALETLRVSRQKVQMGDMSQMDYQDYIRQILLTEEFRPERSYRKLLMSVSLSKSEDLLRDSGDYLAGGFLNLRQEDEYLNALDDFLLGRKRNPRSHVEHSSEGPWYRDEKLAAQKNPMSTINWVRQHVDKSLLQNDEKPTKPKANSRPTKRAAPTNRSTKAEPDYDDEGIAAEAASALKGKRKRDEDPGYRPKGGNPRPSKRRKEESGKKTKRASMDLSAS